MAAVQMDPEVRYYDFAKILIILSLLAAIAALALWGIDRIQPTLNSGPVDVATGAPFLLEGQGQSGEPVRVFANSIELGATTVSDTGVWALMAEAPTQVGTYTIRLIQGEIGPRVADFPGAIRVAEQSDIDAMQMEAAQMAEADTATADTASSDVIAEEAAPEVEMVEPVAMQDSLTFEVNPDPLTNPAAFADGEAILNGIAAPGATIDVILDNVIVASTSADSNGTWQQTVTIDQLGSHLLSLSVVDSNGEQLMLTEAAQIERYPVPTVEIAPDDAVETGEIAFVGTSLAGSKIGVEVNGAIVDRATADDDGVWRWVGTLPTEGGLEVRPVMLDSRDMPLVEGEMLVISMPDGAMIETVVADDAVDEAAVEAIVAEKATAQAAMVEESVNQDPVAEEAVAETAAVATEVPAAVAATAAAVGELKLPDALASDGRFNTFYAALDLTGNVYTLKLDDPFTIFAPTDTAFGALPERVLLGWQNNPNVLRSVLLHHIVEGRRFAADIPFDTPVDNLNQGTIQFVATEAGVLASGATIIDTDKEAANGVIHALDKVILPPSDATKPTIDSSGVATFAGTDLTVVGAADTGVNIIVEMNGERFGTTQAAWDGEFRVQGEVEPGTYEILAWAFDIDDVLLGVSEPVILTVTE